MTDKAEGAFRTIGELSEELGVPQHVLRYWETRFKQLKPLTRAGNRRYYRPDDVLLANQIHHLLHAEGYTIKGVQRVLAGKSGASISADQEPPAPQLMVGTDSRPLVTGLRRIRNDLAQALAA